MDNISAEQRRANMARIRSANTDPEIIVRHGLHARGLRYRLHGNPPVFQGAQK
jgi:DNA mismatch endonuclease (patch repair protein)